VRSDISDQRSIALIRYRDAEEGSCACYEVEF
jgi:hypothetical protein